MRSPQSHVMEGGNRWDCTDVTSKITLGEFPGGPVVTSAVAQVQSLVGELRIPQAVQRSQKIIIIMITSGRI